MRVVDDAIERQFACGLRRARRIAALDDVFNQRGVDGGKFVNVEHLLVTVEIKAHNSRSARILDFFSPAGHRGLLRGKVVIELVERRIWRHNGL
ncbi:hypothetical protein SDC9_67696 [bioreactor metagenome]|uniref:Uncharacterized protein n=1 Tax=bioreactor metagenome TaxID=1076179 RepID=A0A644XYA4_9ZZZZ